MKPWLISQNPLESCKTQLSVSDPIKNNISGVPELHGTHRQERVCEEKNESAKNKTDLNWNSLQYEMSLWPNFIFSY